MHEYSHHIVAANQEQQQRGNPKLLRELATYLWPYRLRAALALTCMIIAASTVLALGQGMKMLIDQGFAAQNQALLTKASWLIVLVIMTMAMASFGRSYLLGWLGERFVADLRAAVFKNLLSLSAGFFDKNRTGELVSRLTADTTLVQTVVTGAVPIALRNIVMLVGGMILLFVTSAKLTGLVFAGVPLILAPILIFGRVVRRRSKQVQEKVAGGTSAMEEALSAIRTVHTFAQEAREQRHIVAKIQDAFTAAVGRNLIRAFLSASVITLVFGAVTLVLWAGGKDVIAGILSPGSLAAFIFYAVIVASSAAALSDVVGDLHKAGGAAERLLELLHMRSDVQSPAAPKRLSTNYSTNHQPVIHFNHVCFAYPLAPQKQILHDLTLQIEPFENIALVGRSGAGKSTLFQLLLRFYDVTDGKISIDGEDIRGLDLQAYRGLFGVVPQEPFIFAASAADNIRYARVGSSRVDLQACKLEYSIVSPK